MSRGRKLHWCTTHRSKGNGKPSWRQMIRHLRPAERRQGRAEVLLVPVCLNPTEGCRDAGISQQSPQVKTGNANASRVKQHAAQQWVG